MKSLRFLNKSENSIAILLTVAMVSLMYPYGFPLFGTLSAFFVILKVITGKFKIRINAGFIIFFMCVLTYFIGLAFNQGIIYDTNKSDITNIISFFLVWVLLSDLSEEDYPKLLHNFGKFAVLASFIVSLIGLYKFYNLLGNVYIPTFYVGDYYPPGTSLIRDYNMFSFSMTAGLMMSVYLISKAKNMKSVFYYLISFSSIFATLLFTGSRRGWIVAVIVGAIVIFLMLKVFARFHKNIIKIIKFGFIGSAAAIFIYLLLILFNIDLDISDSEQIQKLQTRLNTLQFYQIEDSFSERSQRWDYTLQRFNDSNVVQFFVGSGFGYLTDYAREFNTNTAEDYPHNPLLSALLYSGIIGIFLLISLFVWSIIEAVLNYDRLNIQYILLFFISFIFILVSSNSIFSINLFVIMLLLIISLPKRPQRSNKPLT